MLLPLPVLHLNLLIAFDDDLHLSRIRCSIRLLISSNEYKLSFLLLREAIIVFIISIVSRLPQRRLKLIAILIIFFILRVVSSAITHVYHCSHIILLTNLFLIL
jgi:hypothetical protein